MSRGLLVVALALVASRALTAWAGDPSPEEILRRSARALQVPGLECRFELVCNDPTGRRSLKGREYAAPIEHGTGYGRLLVFTDPATIKGTRLLLVHRRGGEEVWWAPAGAKATRLNPPAMGGSVMGSLFTYHDFFLPRSGGATSRVTRSELDEGFDCYVVESTPLSGKRRRLWGFDQVVGLYRKDVFLPMRIDCRVGSTMRTVTYHGVQAMGTTPATWAVGNFEVMDHASNRMDSWRRTELRLNGRMPEGLFNPRILGRPSGR